MRRFLLITMVLLTGACAHNQVTDDSRAPTHADVYSPEITVDQEGGKVQFADAVVQKLKAHSSGFVKCYVRFIGDPRDEFPSKEFQIDFSIDSDRGRVDVEPDPRLDVVENAKYNSADACMRDLIGRIPFKPFGTAQFSVSVKFQ